MPLVKYGCQMSKSALLLLNKRDQGVPSRERRAKVVPEALVDDNAVRRASDRARAASVHGERVARLAFALD